MGFKCIAHNFQQLKNWFHIKRKRLGKYPLNPKYLCQGLVSLSNGITRKNGVEQ